MGNITDINKKGWEYAWVRSVDYQYAGVGLTVMATKPTHVFIEQVHESGDFGELSIFDT